MKRVNNTKEKTEEEKVEEAKGAGGNMASHRSTNQSEIEERPWEPFDEEKHMHLTKTERNNLIYIQRYEKLEWFCEVKTMAKGESFGELALTKDEPRAAAIQCETKCYFAVIQKANYNKLIKKMHYKNEQQHIEFFCKLPYFMHWTNN